jgi:aminoglycoside phosphotransferase (APT) family kinase protein
MTPSETTVYKLVIVDRETQRIMCIPRPTGVYLPVASLDPFVRRARALTQEIARRYRLSTIQLAVLPGDEGEVSYVVHELLDQQSDVSLNHVFITLSEISEKDLPAPPRSTIQAILDGAATGLGRFARLGWTEKLRLRLNADTITNLRQFNCGNNFCLLSMNCDGQRLWFKAVGEPNTREYALTLALARQFPQYLPAVRVAVPEWNAWVAEEVAGVALNEVRDPAAWENALAVVAIMQRHTAESTAVLSAAGAVDWTLSRLLSLLDAFFLEAKRAMQAQTSTRAATLTPQELDLLNASLQSMLLETISSGIPETLIHGDIGHGNVIVSPHGPVFLDWAETYIGHPFISSEHLLADLDQTCGLSRAQKVALRLHYARYWADYIGSKELNRVVAIAPALAAFAYAVMAWERNRYRAFPERAWPLIRSMVRRTKHELMQAEEVAA